jgi:hypothetical protein
MNPPLREYAKVIERLARAACSEASGLARDSEYVNRRWESFVKVATVVYDELNDIEEERFNNQNEDNENDTGSKSTESGNRNTAYDTLGAQAEKGN